MSYGQGHMPRFDVPLS